MLDKFTRAIKKMVYTDGNKCCFCNNFLGLYENVFCSRCLYGISSWNKNYITCKICGKFIKFSKGRIICADCSNAKPPFIMAKAVGPYEGLIREILQKFKYQGMQSLAEPMGRLMALEALKHKEYLQSNIITFVPLSTKRLKERGYNQSQLLASELGKFLQMPVWELLEKVADTEAMAKLTKEQRLKNLAHAFKIKKQVQFQKAILVDDVYTTGSTVSLCCRELFKGGIKEVYVLTFAAGCEIM